VPPLAQASVPADTHSGHFARAPLLTPHGTASHSFSGSTLLAATTRELCLGGATVLNGGGLSLLHRELTGGLSSPPVRHTDDESRPVAKVLQRLSRRCSLADGLSSDAAAARLGYEDVNRLGNFWLLPDGSRVAASNDAALGTGHGRPLYGSKQLPYSALQAFPSGDGRGWGVRSTQPIDEATVVGEMVGRCIDEAAFLSLEDKAYVLSFDDEVLELKRLAGDAVQYIDCKDCAPSLRSLMPRVC
jgi:hypothetical protein